MKLREKFISLSPENRLHGCKIPVVGLTGGIATGKSTASNYLKEKGLKVIDADALVKEIYAKEESLQWVRSLGTQFIVDNQVQFPLLRKWAFQNENNRKQLEQFMYGKLPAAFIEKIEPSDEVLIYDVPLLFEKKLDEKVDTHILIYAPKEIQEIRVKERDGSDQATIEQILNSQMDIEEKKSRSNYVAENTSSIKELYQKLDMLIMLLFQN